MGHLFSVFYIFLYNSIGDIISCVFRKVQPLSVVFDVRANEMVYFYQEKDLRKSPRGRPLPKRMQKYGLRSSFSGITSERDAMRIFFCVDNITNT